MQHNLKTVQPYFNDVESGRKTFEIRLNDRDYKDRDTLVLEEYSCEHGYTGKKITKVVTYVLQNCPQYGLQPGYCILGLGEVE